MSVALQVLRILAVLALLAAAGALATPKGRLPLALRGLAKVLGQSSRPDSNRDAPSLPDANRPDKTLPDLAHRLLALALVLFAAVLACL